MIGEAPSALEKKFQELSEKVVSESGYALYDVEYVKGNKTLRVYIADKNTGSAVIEDCVAVDRAFTDYVEAADWIPDDFVLEVSSPGVYRKLKTAEHFEQARDELVLIELKAPLKREGLPKKLAGSKKIRGKLINNDNEKIILEADGIELEVNVGDIKAANLDPDL